MKIILASQSPRRNDLLAQMGVEFEVVPSNYDEKLDDSRSPEEVAMELALGKAMDVAQNYPDCIVIGSDTIVTVDGRQLEKPIDDEDAHEMLQLLADKSADVSTGLAVVCLASNVKLAGADTARVFFKPYNGPAVKAYIATGNTKDMAGAFGIQNGAAPLISYMSGNYDTIVGLPTILLQQYLESLGVTSRAVSLTSPVPQK